MLDLPSKILTATPGASPNIFSKFVSVYAYLENRIQISKCGSYEWIIFTLMNILISTSDDVI